MAVSILKLVLKGTTTTIPRPVVKRYFHSYNTATEASGVRIVIPHSLFINDAGALMGAAHLTTVVASKGYYLLYVNGVAQESALLTVGSTGSRVILNTGATTLTSSALITLMVSNFNPVSSTVITS